MPSERDGKIIHLASRGGDGSNTSGDRRRHPRTKTIKTGQIVYEDNACVMDCVVLDTSKAGARLKPQDVLACPDEFILKIKFGPIHICKVVERSGAKLGVIFVDQNSEAMEAPSVSSPAPDTAASDDADPGDDATPAGSPDASELTTALIADELAKLVDLRDRGALSDDEFRQIKVKLLGR